MNTRHDERSLANHTFARYVLLALGVVPIVSSCIIDYLFIFNLWPWGLGANSIPIPFDQNLGLYLALIYADIWAPFFMFGYYLLSDTSLYAHTISKVAIYWGIVITANAFWLEDFNLSWAILPNYYVPLIVTLTLTLTAIVCPILFNFKRF